MTSKKDTKETTKVDEWKRKDREKKERKLDTDVRGWGAGMSDSANIVRKGTQKVKQIIEAIPNTKTE